MDPFVLSNHQIYHPGKNFLGNKYIKYWFKDQRFAPLGGLNWANLSDKWYYALKPGITEMATPGTSNHGWGVSIDLHQKTIQDLLSQENAMRWLRDNIVNYGWSRERGVSPDSDPFHLIYYREDAFNSKLIKLPEIESPSAIVTPKPIASPSKPPIVIPPKPKSIIIPKFTPLEPLMPKLNIKGASTKIQNNTKTTATKALPNQFKPFNTLISISNNSSSFKIPTKKTYQNNFTGIPSLKNLDGLPEKVFKVGQPYKGSLDVGGFLTYHEFFEMLIHPQLGNFSFAIAAIFTSISAVEADVGHAENYSEGKIGVGVANGSEHLGFFQLRCKPENVSSSNLDSKDGWFGSPSMLWNAPYNISGEISGRRNH